MSRQPRIGLLGIMQELYDDMIPGITERQGRYAQSVAQRLAGVAEVTFSRPARNREDVEAIARELVAADVDGIMIVMLTYGPAMRTVRALLDTPVPLLLANIQPERTITARVGHGGPHLQPGHPRRAGSGQLAGPLRGAVLGDHRRLGVARVRGRVRGLGARRADGDRPAPHADRAARLSDERDGRHPLRPAGDAAPARPDGGVRGPRAGGGAHPGGLRCRGGLGHRPPPRSVRDRRRPSRANVTRTPPASKSRCAGCSTTTATPASRSTSTRSAATGASSSCRCWPPRT